MGAVYQGWLRSLDRFVAIKILPLGIEGGDGDFAARFRREAKAMARLKNPGIIPVHDAGETPDGLLYFVMDYVEGTDAQKLIAAQGRLPPEQALAITTHVLDALAYAHQHGIIHRDIKPANIMLDHEGHVQVAHFGLARSISGDTSLLTGSQVTMGTPDFMAPESRIGTVPVDHRGDLYAVGVMLYQMLIASNDVVHNRRARRGEFMNKRRRRRRRLRVGRRALLIHNFGRYQTAVPNCFICPLTARTSTRSNWPFPNSKPFCGNAPNAPSPGSGAPPLKLWISSPPLIAPTSFAMPNMRQIK